MVKTQTHKILYQSLSISLVVGFATLFTTVQANAEEVKQILKTQIHIDSDGMAIQQPVISQTEILDTLTQAHRLLTKQGDTARKIVNESDTGGNMVVAAIIPGGLLYLAYQQSKLTDAKTTLAEIKHELENLDKDAVTLYKPVYKPTNRPIVIARYP